MSPISSRNIVPLSANSTSKLYALRAGVCSLFMTEQLIFYQSFGIAAQFTATKGPSISCLDDGSNGQPVLYGPALSRISAVVSWERPCGLLPVPGPMLADTDNFGDFEKSRKFFLRIIFSFLEAPSTIARLTIISKCSDRKAWR